MLFKLKPILFQVILISCISVVYSQNYPSYYDSLLNTDNYKYRKTIFGTEAIADVGLFKPITVNLGMNYFCYFKIMAKTKETARKSKYDIVYSERDLYIKPSFGFIYRERYHTGLMFVPSIVYRHTAPRGFYAELNLDVGMYYAKLNAPTYKQNDDGSFEKIHKGFSKFLLGGKFYGGYDFSKKVEIPLNVFAGFGVFYTYPENQNWVRHITAQIGLAFIIRKNYE
ncbi:MAG: hypothetical protein H6553_07760 [Chitinophagales bacterium]|nr:hypothetical protein [Chitinophagales bacterium]